MPLSLKLFMPSQLLLDLAQKEIVPAEDKVLTSVSVSCDPLLPAWPALNDPACTDVPLTDQPLVAVNGDNAPVSKPSMKLAEEASTSSVAPGAALLIPTNLLVVSTFKAEAPEAS